MHFDPTRLVDLSEESLINELQRISELIGEKKLTTSIVKKYGKVSPDTIRRRLGSWEEALIKAGLYHKYSGKKVSTKMKTQLARKLTDEQLINELKSVAKKLKKSNFTQKEFNANSGINSASLVRRFESWSNAMRFGGLEVSNRGKRYKTIDYHNNLMKVWSFYGRKPKYREMDHEPSKITAGAYERKFGSWSNAINEFIGKINDVSIHSGNKEKNSNPKVVRRTRDRRDISLTLRYKVLKRDNFTCVTCGNSPAKNTNCELHVDHMVPWSKGGKTSIENLQTKCKECNLGKSNN